VRHPIEYLAESYRAYDAAAALQGSIGERRPT
jgi:hypothetical protein